MHSDIKGRVKAKIQLNGALRAFMSNCLDENVSKTARVFVPRGVLILTVVYKECWVC